MLCFSLSPELGTVRCCTSATWMHFAHCTRTKQGNSLSGITFGKPLKTIEGYGLTISYFRQLWQFDSRPARSTKNRGRRKSRLTTRPSFSRWLLNIGLDMSKLAERVGFEPTLEFPLNTLSKRAPSATRPSLRRFEDASAERRNAATTCPPILWVASEHRNHTASLTPPRRESTFLERTSADANSNNRKRDGSDAMIEAKMKRGRGNQGNQNEGVKRQLRQEKKQAIEGNPSQ